MAPDALKAQRREHAVALYKELRSVQKVAGILGCSPMTVWRDIKAAGVTLFHTNEPKTEERICARDGCENRFRPTPRQVRLGYGKFCSRHCDHEAHRIYEKPTERECARPGCENRFTPTGSNVAMGWGSYCSKRCSAVMTYDRKRKKGQIVACDHCGEEFWRYDCALLENNFCSRECWNRYRWKHGLAISPDLVSLTTGRARQRWYGRWAGRKYGHLGGRRRVEVSDTQTAEIMNLANQGWGRRAIASRLLVSERAVRNVLDQES
jgi:hypothetical protein